MIGRDVEGGEVVVITFDLRPLGNAVAKARKDIEDLLGCGDQGMAMAGGVKLGGAVTSNLSRSSRSAMADDLSQSMRAASWA